MQPEVLLWVRGDLPFQDTRPAAEQHLRRSIDGSMVHKFRLDVEPAAVGPNCGDRDHGNACADRNVERPEDEWRRLAEEWCDGCRGHAGPLVRCCGDDSTRLDGAKNCPWRLIPPVRHDAPASPVRIEECRKAGILRRCDDEMNLLGPYRAPSHCPRSDLPVAEMATQDKRGHSGGDERPQHVRLAPADARHVFRGPSLGKS